MIFCVFNCLFIEKMFVFLPLGKVKLLSNLILILSKNERKQEVLHCSYGGDDERPGGERFRSHRRNGIVGRTGRRNRFVPFQLIV